MADLTTFRVGGPAPHLMTVRSRSELVDCCSRHRLQPDRPDRSVPDVLFVGGGSNLLIADEGFTGPACVIRSTGIDERPAGTGQRLLTVEAGENWDAFVASTLRRGLTGLEALSGIPGSVGATPIQNVGAYGAEVAESIDSVLAFDRITGEQLRFGAQDLGFGYRTSMFKRTAAEHGAVRFVVLAVTFRLPEATMSAPVRYSQLARALGVEIGARVSACEVREAVLALRASKGMVLDDADHDTWSAGSFFTNPILPADAVLPEDAPRYPVTDPLTGAQDPAVVKTSAAWLIDHAGFAKGFGIGDRRATLSTKHTLALTNRGDASTADLLELARRIRDGVEGIFGIRLEPEPNLVGCRL
nr:UDP-N-acetylmuramate dehydrogenase [Brevibacterium daeguense]